MQNYDHLGQVFKNLRTNRHISLKQISNERVSAAQISRFERGESDISLEKFLIALSNMHIEVSEFMDADKIKSVEQLPAGGIGRMMAIYELVIIDHDSRAAIGGNVIVAAFHNRRLIDIREKSRNGRFDAICAAERADDAALFKRIILRLFATLTNSALAGRGR